ncbi:MAG: hypothetical protein AAGA23_15150 [Pseudomonadota bacterium]
MRFRLATTTVLAALLAAVLPAAASDGDYRYGLESLERSQFAAAVAAFEAAIQSNPQPALAKEAGGLDYLPYLNLAVARHGAGDAAGARQALDQSAGYGVVSDSFLGQKLWDRYALSIMATDQSILAEDTQADYRTFERKDFTLSDADAKTIKRQVLRRCALTGKGPADDLPWYFHYEYGLDLMAAGDPQRALDELILAANLREDSKRRSRMYGMWFTDYLPYFQIAQAHSKLGNWQCAMDAMRVSTRQGEFSPVDPGYQQYSDLQKLIQRQSQG